MTALGVIIACGLLAIVYGIWAIWSVMQADPGNARMQEIAAAVREGAQAYLKRQYTTIGIVGVVIFALLVYFLGTLVAVGFANGFARESSKRRIDSSRPNADACVRARLQQIRIAIM